MLPDYYPSPLIFHSGKRRGQRKAAWLVDAPNTMHNRTMSA
jgi:hypothetical protein